MWQITHKLNTEKKGKNTDRSYSKTSHITHSAFCSLKKRVDFMHENIHKIALAFKKKPIFGVSGISVINLILLLQKLSITETKFC